MLGYSIGKSLTSRLIQWFTWVGRDGPSHVMWVESGGECYESWHKKDKNTAHNGARRGFVGDLHKIGTIIELYAVPMVCCEHNDMVTQLDIMVDQVRKYDWTGAIFGFLLRSNAANNKWKLFCSEMILRGFKLIDYTFIQNTEPNQGSPGMMYRMTRQKKVGEYVVGDEWVCPKLPKGYA